MYAQLGSIVFDGLYSPDTFRGRRSQALAQHELIDGKPRLQKTGDALEEIQLDIQLHSRFCDPEAKINELHAACANGQILPLVTGAGEFVGDFTIAEVSRSYNHLDNSGRIIWARVGLSLLEVVSDSPADLVMRAAKAVAFASAKNEPPLVPPASFSSLQGAGISAMSSLGAAGAHTASADRQLVTAKAQPLSATTEMNKAKANLEKAQGKLAEYETKLQEVKDTISNFTQIKSNIDSAVNFAQITIDAIDDADLDGAITASQTLQSGMFNLRGASSNVATLTAIRRV